MKKNIFILTILLLSCVFAFGQGTAGEYTGGSATGGFDSGCGYADAGNADPGVSDVGIPGNACGSAFDATFGAWTETATGFDITGFELNNYDIDDEAAYGIRMTYGPQNDCCTVCLDAMLDLGQGAACGTFGPQANLASFGYPIPAVYGADIFGSDIIPYADMCPNTEYFAFYQLISATGVDLTNPDGNDCSMDDALINNFGTLSTVQTIVAPGTRDPLVINNATLTSVAAAADCASMDVLLDFTVDITAGCEVSFGTCSQGLELEFRASLACDDGTNLDISTGGLLNDPIACVTGDQITGGQISLGTAADVCAIFACDPNASLELYATYTFCEADDIVGDGSGNDEAVFSISIADIIADYDAAMCCAPVACSEFNALSYGPACNGYDICVGYVDTDQDGIGDAGEDPTGMTLTVTDGIATSVAQTPLNDGIFFFDADGDDITDAVGYCYTVLFDNPTCDPEPYTPLVTVTCADGSAGVLVAGFGGSTLTDLDILDDQFGIPGGTAIYPTLGGFITPAVCPAADGTGGVAAFAEVFVVDAAGDPVGTACTTVTGEIPTACDGSNTTDAAIPVQWNPINDPLLTAVIGAGAFTCGFDATADLTYTCNSCVACPEFNAVTYGPACNGYDICVGYVDTDQDGIGDAGEDPTGMTLTVTDGIATSVAQAPLNDGIFFFDADGDDITDAVGYCYTVLFDNPTCDPEPYTPLVTVTCGDGSAGVLVAGFGGSTLTDLDILDDQFGIPGGTAIYPTLGGFITPAVCPAADGTGGVAALAEVFVVDAGGAPVGTACTTVTGEIPTACDGSNTTDAAVPVQWNPINDPLLTALIGAGDFTCGFDATADLTYACNTCAAVCEPYSAITVSAGCDVFDVCIGYVDIDQDGLSDIGGADPTGTAMTIDFGAATGGTLLNDGIFVFDTNSDGVNDAVGYCVTYIYEEQACDPVPYPGLVTLTCPDGTAGVLDLSAAGGPVVTLTNIDLVGDVFGVPGGGAFYPVLTATTTPAVCPTLPDNSDGAAAFVEVTSPDGTVCETITGEAPACDTAGGNAAEPVQVNPVTDPLLTALFGADPAFPYVCTIDETADLSYNCGTCGMCAIVPAAATNIVCDDAGTPGDPSDDTYTFDILVNGNNPAVGATQTFDDDQGNAGVAYGTTVSYGPFPIAGGNITVTFTDADDAACTATMMATAPATCSGAVCDISVDITNFACNDGGTPDDPSDDTVTFDYTVTDIGGIGTTWSSDQGDAGATYGTTVSIGPLPAGIIWTINVMDDGDASCTATDSQELTDCGPSPVNIPTLSEWGLITLALLLMTFGSVKMAVGSVALANTSSRNIPVPGGSMRLPFDSAIFRKSFMITGLLALVGFAICFAMYATIFMSDIIGVAVAGPIFAYLGHLLYLLETRKEK